MGRFVSKQEWYNEIVEDISQRIAPLRAEVKGSHIQVVNPHNDSRVASLNLLEDKNNLIVIESLQTARDYQGLGLGRTITHAVTQLAQREDTCVELCAEGQGVYFWPKNGFWAADYPINIGNSYDGDKIACSHTQLVKRMKIYSDYSMQNFGYELAYNTHLKSRGSQVERYLESIKATSLEAKYALYQGLCSLIEESDSKDVLWRVVEHPFAPILLQGSRIHMIWDSKNTQQVQKRDEFFKEKNLEHFSLMYSQGMLSQSQMRGER
jgi:hypothetical protein